jgi:hypothetical protein
MKDFLSTFKPMQFLRFLAVLIILFGSVNILISSEYLNNKDLSNSNLHELSAPYNGHVTCYEILESCGTLNFDVYFCNGCTSKMCSSYQNARKCVVSSTGSGSGGSTN